MEKAVDFQTLLSILGIATIILLAVFGFIGHFIKKAREDINRIDKCSAVYEERLKGYENILKLVQETYHTFVTQTLDMIRILLPKNTSGNPHTAEERDDLLDKYRRSELTLNEAVRLREILEEEKRIAMQSSTNPWLAFAIGILIGGLAGLIVGLSTRDE